MCEKSYCLGTLGQAESCFAMEAGLFWCSGCGAQAKCGEKEVGPRVYPGEVCGRSKGGGTGKGEMGVAVGQESFQIAF